MNNTYDAEQVERAESVKHSEKQNLKSIKLDHPIDLRFKYKKGLFGRRKKVPTTETEQRKLKKAFMQVFPDNLFIDNLYDKNSVLTKEQREYRAEVEADAAEEIEDVYDVTIGDIVDDVMDCFG